MSERTTRRAAASSVQEVPLKGPTFFARSVRRFFTNRAAVAGLAYSIVITLLSAFAPWISRWEPQEIDWEAIRKPPSATHWLGTDLTGRDMFSRLMHGGRVSLLIGLAAWQAKTEIHYDGKTGRINNTNAANPYLKRSYREGWPLNG